MVQRILWFQMCAVIASDGYEAVYSHKSKACSRSGLLCKELMSLQHGHKNPELQDDQETILCQGAKRGINREINEVEDLKSMHRDETYNATRFHRFCIENRSTNKKRLDQKNEGVVVKQRGLERPGPNE